MMKKFHLVKNNLYIHIPFCSHICSYCDFCKLIYDEEMASKYINELLKEIDSYKLGLQGLVNFLTSAND